MKRILLMILFVGALFSTKAQKTTFLAAGASVSNDKFYDNVEIGRTIGKNSLSLVGTSNGLLMKDMDTYSAGVKYSRNIFGDSTFDIQLNTAAKMNLTGANKFLIVEPGVAATYYVAKWMGVRFTLSSPIYEGNTNLRQLNVSGGLQLVVRL